MRFLTLTLFSFLLLPACTPEEASIDSTPVNGTFLLKYGERLTFDNDDFEVAIRDIRDWRCEENEDCSTVLWDVVLVDIDLFEGEARTPFTFAIEADPSSDLFIEKQLGYTFRLLNVFPDPPLAGGSVNLYDYSIEIKIE